MVKVYDIHDKLKEKISSLSKDLEGKYREVLDLSWDEFRAFIKKEVGTIKALERLEKEKLNLYQKKGGIVGVDGSSNRMGGSHPHFVEAYQALAKSTTRKDHSIVLADIYTPLEEVKREDSILEDIDRDGEVEDTKNIKLATLEVEAALEAVEDFQPYAIVMDGGLRRYIIYAKESWIKLRSLCEERDILLIGVIEDIKTSIIGDTLKKHYRDMDTSIYDREILFGKLQYGEMISINERVNKKGLEGYSSAFIRSSRTPTVIGMDILDSQKTSMEDMARLVLTLTPENSRGIPLWLDIVDKEAKISDEMMKSLLESYMDRGLYERFFISQRDKRH